MDFITAIIKQLKGEGFIGKFEAAQKVQIMGFIDPDTKEEFVVIVAKVPEDN